MTSATPALPVYQWRGLGRFRLRDLESSAPLFPRYFSRRDQQIIAQNIREFGEERLHGFTVRVCFD